MDVRRPGERLVYDYVDPGKIPDIAKCSICLEPMRDPKMTACGHAFCSQCISRWLQGHDECPICRKKMTGKPANADGTLLKILNSAIVRCGNSPQCTWVGERIDYQTHLTGMCLRAKLPCAKGCGKEIVRCLLDDHYVQDCDVAKRERKDEATLRLDALQARVHELEGTVQKLEIEKAEASVRVQSSEVVIQQLRHAKAQQRESNARNKNAWKVASAKEAQLRQQLESNLDAWKVALEEEAQLRQQLETNLDALQKRYRRMHVELNSKVLEIRQLTSKLQHEEWSVDEATNALEAVRQLNSQLVDQGKQKDLQIRKLQKDRGACSLVAVVAIVLLIYFGFCCWRESSRPSCWV